MIKRMTLVFKQLKKKVKRTLNRTGPRIRLEELYSRKEEAELKLKKKDMDSQTSK